MNLLFVHGVGGRPRTWSRVVEQLDPALHNDVLTADIRPRVGQSINEIAHHLLDRFPGSHIIIGHSLGGMLAQEVALIDRTRVQGLVLVSTIPGATPGVAAHNQALATDIEDRGIRTVADEFADRLFAPGRLTRDPALKSDFTDAMVESGASAVCASLRAIAQWDASKCLTGLASPAEVIAGDAEPDLDRQRQLATQLRAPFRLVDGTGHLAPLEAPECVARAIERVLSRLLGQV
jgi:pimeloyl-ACP methyl ester carboxylesterase